MRISVNVQPCVFLLAAASLLLLPIPWLIAWCIALIVHELSHYIVLKILRIPVHSVKIGISGAQIKTGPISDGKQVLCALAGPLGGLSLCMFSELFPRLAVCALVQSVYNLIPLYPLDGGRVLSGLLILILGNNRGTLWAKRTEILFLVILLAGGTYLTILLQMSPLVFLLLLLFIIRSVKIKLPCKAQKQIVQ